MKEKCIISKIYIKFKEILIENFLDLSSFKTKYKTDYQKDLKNYKIFCEKCNQRIKFNSGEMRKDHFSHYKTNFQNNQENKDYLTHNNAILKLKEILSSGKIISFVRHCKICNLKTKRFKYIFDEKTDEIIIDDNINYQRIKERFDLFVYRKNNPLFGVEVFNTHKTKKRNFKCWFELKIENIISLNLLGNKKIINIICDRNYSKDCNQIKIKELTSSQKIVFNNVLNFSKENTHICISVTGNPGTGKSYLIKKLKKYFEHHKIDYNIITPTGISALIVEGNTLHSQFKIPINLKIDSKKNIESQIKDEKFSEIIKNILTLKFLIFDESSMIKLKDFEYLNLLFQCVKKNNLFFGGVNLILFGDPYQIEPVKEEKSFYETEVFRNNFINLNLSEVKRQEKGSYILNILNNIRNNYFYDHTNDIKKDLIKIKEIKDFLDQRKISNENVSKFYEEYKDKLITIVSTNEECKEINLQKYDKIEQEEKIFDIIYKRIPENNLDLSEKTEEYDLDLNELSVVCDLDLNEKREELLLKKLKENEIYLGDKNFKVGCKVMFTKNNNKIGYKNGLRGIIVEIKEKSIIVKTEETNNKIKTIEVGYIEEKSECERYNIKFIPLKLCYAITAHKSQGQTIKYLEIDLPDGKNISLNVLYTSLSRVENEKYLFIKNYPEKSINLDIENLEKEVQKLYF